MQSVVGVRFNPSGKIYFFNPNNVELEVGDNCIVDCKIGLSYGTVAVKNAEIEEIELSEPLKKVVRKATEQDKKKYSELKEKAQNDINLVREKVKKFGLDMKIVSAEYCFDGSKIIIDFSADDRVDFRDLLKELASALKVRIELHQVGQRDEVKLKGGLGPCGQECCCVKFLKDFEHVTVKMAKNQGLSLSPTKISGLCGRLMCCLAYENKAYEEVLKRMPKINKPIDTPKGQGVVVYNDLLRERVSVKIQNNDDSFVVYDFSLAELNGEVPLKEKEEQKETQVEEVVEIKEEQKNEVQEKTQQSQNKDSQNNQKNHNNNHKKNDFRKNKHKFKNKK